MGSPYTVNGLFLSQPVAGVQRYARELLSETDRLLVDPQEVDLEVAVPDGSDTPDYKNIRVVRVGGKRGIPWEQNDFARYLTKSGRQGINLCNTLPLRAPSGIVAIHDISYKVNPQFFQGPRNTVSRMWHCRNYSVSFDGSDRIITVSRFSRDEIVRVYGVDPRRISVIPNAWQHMERIEPDDSVVRSLGLRDKGFYFTVSSLAPNKNIGWIINSARLTPEVTFVIAGGSTLEESFFDVPSNVRFVGRVTDGQMKALMSSCAAFLFPTLYEGFGIPPLEAMACGAKAVVSDTPCMHEVFGDGAVYIDPTEPQALPPESLGPLDGERVLARYSWTESAKLFLQLVQNADEG